MASYYSGATLSREQTASVLYQAGFRGGVLTQLVAIGGRESGYIAGAHRTDSSRDRLSGDRGLFQINSTWDAQLKQAGIIKQASDLFDPLTNAKAALFVYQRQGLAAWGMGSGGWSGSGNPMYNTNLGAAQTAVQNAANKGLLGQDWNSTQTPSSGGGATSTAAAGSGALPSDTKLVRNDNGLFALFQIAPGVWIHYGVSSGTNTSGRPIERVSNKAYNAKYGMTVGGGNASELADIPTGFGTYKAFVNSVLDQLFPPGDPRRQDNEVMRIIAEITGRPDMTPAEIENKLKATKYYQNRTQGELEWNDISESERQTRRNDMEARMSQAYLAIMGTSPSAGAMSRDARLEDLASGKMGFGAWTEQYLKPRAAANPESPWSRQLRDEKEAQLQRPVDIENTVAQLRDKLSRWGVTWSEKTLEWYGRALVENRKSDDDVNKTISEQAAVLYPWKTDKNMETVVAAAPWIETYNRLMERQGSLKTPEIAKALSGMARDPDNNDPWAFEQKLKASEAWSNTKNGATEMNEIVGDLAKLTGMG